MMPCSHFHDRSSFRQKNHVLYLNFSLIFKNKQDIVSGNSCWDRLYRRSCHPIVVKIIEHTIFNIKTPAHPKFYVA